MAAFYAGIIVGALAGLLFLMALSRGNEPDELTVHPNRSAGGLELPPPRADY
jgi:hypothetical protein